MITIFTPSFADKNNTNAQNLTVKEIVVRLPPDKFRVILLYERAPDPRITTRENTQLLKWSRHGNTARILTRLLLSRPNLYFFPREGPLDAAFLFLRHSMGLKIALVTYVVATLDRGVSSATLARAIEEADTVLGNSSYVSETIHQRFGVQAKVIHTGINRQLFYPPDEGRESRPQLTVLYAGSFQARKRADVVISEAAKWPSIQFRLAGQGEEETACRCLAERLGCRNVTFVGHLAPSELAQEMRQADIFLFPSMIEGHPQILGQAAACGLPCIAMNVYRPDYVVQGETGFLVGSDAELSQTLQRLLTNQELRLMMSAAAAQHAVRFDWNTIIEYWESVFEEAMRRRQVIF